MYYDKQQDFSQHVYKKTRVTFAATQIETTGIFILGVNNMTSDIFMPEIDSQKQ